MSSAVAESQVETQTEVQQVKEKKPKAAKSKKTVRETTPEVPEVQHPMASKLSEYPGLRRSQRAGFESVWRIEGLPGLYCYSKGCKANYQPEEGEVVAGVKESHAVFVRETTITNMFCDVLGVKQPS